MSFVSGRVLRKTLQEQMQLYFPGILEQVCIAELETYDPVTHPAPRQWTRLSTEEILTLATDQSPMVAVTSPGLAGDVVRDATGEYRAPWQLSVIVAVRGQSFEEVADSVGLYCAAARITVAQHGLGMPNVEVPRWIGERYDELDPRKGRSLGGGRVDFRVVVSGALDDLPLTGPQSDSTDIQVGTLTP